MSSFSACLVLKGMGLDPVMQMVCRDRNRIAIQSDILGAAALGINNLLPFRGSPEIWRSSNGKNVFDIDSIQLIQTVKLMRDEGKFISGEEVKGKPNIFIGCAENPFADPFEIRALRLRQSMLRALSLSRPSASLMWRNLKSGWKWFVISASTRRCISSRVLHP